MALTSLADQEMDEHVNALYYGEGGSGKSTGAASLARLGRIIYVNAESGIKSKPLRRLGVPTENIMLYTVSTYKELDNLYWQVKAMLDSNPGSVVGVVFDSMTEIQKKLMEEIMGARHAKHTSAGMVSDEFSAERDEYGRMTEQVRRISRRFRDLPCHVVFVCLAKREIDSDGAFYRPMLTPAFASDLVGYVDVVLYTVQQPGEKDDFSRFVGVSRPVGQARGKDRFGALPAIMPNPTMDRVVDYVNSEDYEEHAVNDPFMALYLKRTGGLPDSPDRVEGTEVDPEAQSHVRDMLFK